MCSDSIVGCWLLDSNWNMVLEGEVTMKKRTLNQTWVLCLRMWRSIAKVWREGNNVHRLKRIWINENGFSMSGVDAHCFFCDHNVENPGCSDCPGKLVDPNFCCESLEYDYETKPIAFYKELLRLNRIRKEKK